MASIASIFPDEAKIDSNYKKLVDSIGQILVEKVTGHPTGNILDSKVCSRWQLSLYTSTYPWWAVESYTKQLIEKDPRWSVVSMNLKQEISESYHWGDPNYGVESSTSKEYIDLILCRKP